MPFILGSTNIQALRRGAKPITRAYANGVKRFGWDPAISEAIQTGADKELALVRVGTGDVEQSLSTGVWIPDADGTYRTWPANSVPRSGGRHVENLFRYSEDLTQGSAWGGDLGSTPYRVDFGATQYIYQVADLNQPILGKAFVVRVGIRGDGPVGFELRRGNATAYRIALKSSFPLTGAFQNFTFGGVCLEDPDGLDNLRLFVIRREDTTYFEIEPGNGFQLEECSGRDLIPSEYLLTTNERERITYGRTNPIEVEGDLFTEDGESAYIDPGFVTRVTTGANRIPYSRDFSQWVANSVIINRGSVGIDGNALGASIAEDQRNDFAANASSVVEDMPGEDATYSLFVAKDFSARTSYPMIRITSGDYVIFMPFDPATGQFSLIDNYVPSPDYGGEVTDEGAFWRVTVYLKKDPDVAVSVGFFPAVTQAIDPFSFDTTLFGSIVIDQAQVTNLSLSHARGQPPIHTEGASVAIAGGDIIYTGLPSDFSDVRGVIYVEVVLPFSQAETPQQIQVLGINLIYVHGVARIANYDGVGPITNFYSWSANELLRIALAYDRVANKRAIIVNGDESAESTYTGTMPISNGVLFSNSPRSGRIRRILFFDESYDRGILLARELAR